MTSLPPLLRTALLGASTGLRSQMGLAAVVVRTDPDGLPRPLRNKAARPLAVTAAVGELVGDKLPKTPSRTEPLGLGGRVVFGGLAGGLLAAAERRAVVPAVALAAGVALAATFGGHRLRVTASRHAPDLVVALAEDALSVGLAVAAT